MTKITYTIGWLLLVSGLGFYLYGIIFAIFDPIKVIEGGNVVCKIPDALETVITSVGAILLTNLGAVLGISVVRPEAAISRITMSPSVNIPDPITLRDKIQAAAVLLYIISLIACTIAWAVATFREKPEPVVSLIPQYAKTFIGVITAYIAFVLAKKT